ncbi:GIN domain-containing protein [Xenorhabdus szentirmaii]|uniref:GIN domain-containing protein n=1 Tax=Xenorhabdus szentirmaii TaxID=290112 RepID=UPI0019C05515|nr:MULTISPECIES: DUF2807 domain-containing protein [unclassified Xenorhabdus]MBD2793952.1 DUF2807 domain-containing protein [Xenorhabdus sp. CUL]MBD2826451.1 DUF2807 domain-containing protein [Xenorhabdus sp. 5]
MKKLAILMAFISGAAFHSAMAAEKTVKLQKFTGVNAQKGIKLTIKCADASSLNVKGPQSAINKLDINFDGNMLNLINEANNKNNRFSESLDITLYTNQPLNNISTKQGVKATVAACAVNSEKLKVTGEMGSQIDVEGQTKHLGLELNMGAIFNEPAQKFRADSAQISLSMGAKASLCHIPNITGYLTAGASISVDKDAVVKIKDNITSHVSTISCS